MKWNKVLKQPHVSSGQMAQIYGKVVFRGSGVSKLWLRNWVSPYSYSFCEESPEFEVSNLLRLMRALKDRI